MMRILLVLSILLAAPSVARAAPIILVVGDSLSAAYGMDVGQGWVVLLQQRLVARDYPHAVVNASQSGATTDGAAALLARSIKRHKPAIVIIEIGGNDGLRGLPLVQMRRNLAKMVRVSTAAGASVVLTGIRIPPNYGAAYTQGFHRIYYELAEEFDATLVPDLLERVALDPDLMLADGIHPNPQAQPLILDTIWPFLEPLLGQSAAITGGK